MVSSVTPATRVSQRLTGMSTRAARLWPTATAMAGVTSPSSASAMTMPMGPAITSALRQATMTAFSPVAALRAPALSMLDVAMLLVPTAMSSAPGSLSVISRTSARPMLPPWPSMTSMVTMAFLLTGIVLPL